MCADEDTAPHLCSENMCLSCSSGPRSTANDAIDSIEPSVKNRQNFCGRSSTSGKKAPESTNMNKLRDSSTPKYFHFCREAKGSPSPKPERKGTRSSRLLPLRPRVQSKEKLALASLSSTGVCGDQKPATPGQTSPSGFCRDGERPDHDGGVSGERPDQGRADIAQAGRPPPLFAKRGS
jgi:hypothetical protein